ncbi:hypothetical protein D3C86_1749200 [compost metagenome]
MPTHGENYGHAIAEALSAGTPVLISDATPWRGLQQEGVGWDIPLGEGAAAFASAIKMLASTEVAEREAQRNRAYAFAVRQLSDSALVEDNRKVFTKWHDGGW